MSEASTVYAAKANTTQSSQGLVDSRLSVVVKADNTSNNATAVAAADPYGARRRTAPSRRETEWR